MVVCHEFGYLLRDRGEALIGLELGVGSSWEVVASISIGSDEPLSGVEKAEILQALEAEGFGGRVGFFLPFLLSSKGG